MTARFDYGHIVVNVAVVGMELVVVGSAGCRFCKLGSVASRL